MKLKTITTAILILIGCNAYSQQFELDLEVGVHLSKSVFHHTSAVTTDKQEYESYESSNFMIGLTSPIAKQNWYLETEIGFLKTNSFLSIIYDYDEGLGQQSAAKVTYLTNQKVYLSVAPEYRINIQSLILKFNAGALFTSDISNTMSSINKVLLPKSNPMGVKVGTGIQFIKNGIGAELNLSYASIGESTLENIYHPKISYNLIILNFGIVYAIGK